MTHDFKAALAAYEFDTFAPDEFYNLYGETIRAALELADKLKPRPMKKAPINGDHILACIVVEDFPFFVSGYCEDDGRFITTYLECEFDQPLCFYDLSALPKPSNEPEGDA